MSDECQPRTASAYTKIVNLLNAPIQTSVVEVLHTIATSDQMYATEDLPTVIENLSLHDSLERDMEDQDENAAASGNGFALFRSLVERHICGSMGYVHTTSKLDSFKFSIGESLYLRESPVMTLYAPIQQIALRQPWSTVVVLDRGPFLAPLHAVSGWGHKDDPSCISGQLWTEQVFLVADYVGHNLTPDGKRDQGRPGWFNASHAEKQALAFLLRHHTRFKDIWGNEGYFIYKKRTNALKSLVASRKRKGLKYEECKKSITLLNEVLKEENTLRDDLMKSELVPLQKADMFLSREQQCLDCEAFFERVHQAFNLNVTVHKCQLFEDSKRPILPRNTASEGKTIL